MSIAGAFLGPIRTEDLFESKPATFIWLVSAVYLLFILLRVKCKSVVSIAFLGALLVLGGFFLRSDMAFAIKESLWDGHKIPNGIMVIHEGASESVVTGDDSEEYTLPFKLKLMDFSIEYYDDKKSPRGGMIKDYISHLQVIDGNRIVKEKAVEVNSPLYYNGYLFYQYSYDEKKHIYSVIKVVANDGVVSVFLGYALVGFAILFYCWIIKLRLI